MDENGNKIKQNNDVKYITDTNGQTIAIADTDDFADNLDSAKWDQRSIDDLEKLSNKEIIGLSIFV